MVDRHGAGVNCKKRSRSTIMEMYIAALRRCPNSQSPSEQLTLANASLRDLRKPSCLLNIGSGAVGLAGQLSQERTVSDSHTFSNSNKPELVRAGEFPLLTSLLCGVSSSRLRARANERSVSAGKRGFLNPKAVLHFP